MILGKNGPWGEGLRRDGLWGKIDWEYGMISGEKNEVAFENNSKVTPHRQSGVPYYSEA